jgi:hypothetical protein
VGLVTDNEFDRNGSLIAPTVFITAAQGFDTSGSAGLR